MILWCSCGMWIGAGVIISSDVRSVSLSVTLSCDVDEKLALTIRPLYDVNL